MLQTKLYNGIVEKPYLCSKEKRWYIHIKLENGRLCLTLARFLYQEYIGRILSSKEEVDHIDENKLNDSIENLQILSEAENIRKSNTHNKTKYFQLKEICFWCDKKFILTPKQQQQKVADLKRGRNPNYYCSRSCSNKFAATQRI
jgi:hypothetical protein